MRRKCKGILKTFFQVIFFTGLVILTLFIASVGKRSITRTPGVSGVTSGLAVQRIRSTETLLPSPKLPTHSTLKFTTDRPDLSIILPRTASICLKKEAIRSAKIKKLGSYPQQKRFLSIGISSITRPSGQIYLKKTIKRLIDSLSEEDRRKVFLVIFLADFDESLKSATLNELSILFKKYADQGLLQVIFAPREFYPPLSDLKTKFGDSRQRIFWRSKLVVDFAFLMCYCKDLSKYYLHLEDDLIPAPSFYLKFRHFITSQKNPWPILDAAFMGHTAKVYHSSDLENIATYFYLMYDEMPGDWLIALWRKIKYDGQYYKEFVLPPASLFQHIGDSFSFIENNNYHKSKERFFDEYDIKYKGLNPPANISSSMNSADGTKLEHAYNKGGGYFWANGIRKGDFIVIQFIPATTIREVFVETGSYLALTDHLKSGVLQASFMNNGSETEVNGAANCKEFETIGDFKDGRVKVSLLESRKLFCLRVLVTGYQAGWLFVREIAVL